MAYLFMLESFVPRPTLSVTQSNGSVIVSWPKAADDFVLDESISLSGDIPWAQVPRAIYQSNATDIFITAPTPSDSKFYRLRQPF